MSGEDLPLAVCRPLHKARNARKQSKATHFRTFSGPFQVSMEHLTWVDIDYRGDRMRYSFLRAYVGGSLLEVSTGYQRRLTVNGQPVAEPRGSCCKGDFEVMQWLKREVLSGRLGKHDPATAIRSN